MKVPACKMKPQIGFFFSELQGPSLIINLAQLASASVALPAELVLYQISKDIQRKRYLKLKTENRQIDKQTNKSVYRVTLQLKIWLKS